MRLSVKKICRVETSEVAVVEVPDDCEDIDQAIEELEDQGKIDWEQEDEWLDEPEIDWEELDEDEEEDKETQDKQIDKAICDNAANLIKNLKTSRAQGIICEDNLDNLISELEVWWGALTVSPVPL